MEDILEKIVTTKRKKLLYQRHPSLTELADLFLNRTHQGENKFYQALNQNPGPNIIAEVKFASPSKGKLLERFTLRELVYRYQKAGACAISVVTEETFFRGYSEMVREVKECSTLPVLQKDFVIEESQIYQAAKLGADALLLIARILSLQRLKKFVELCQLLNITPLVEVHDESDIQKALQAEAPVIGINNRNLATFEVSIQNTIRLRKYLPKEKIVVSESGIVSFQDIELLLKQGVHNFLVGESLIKAEEPDNKLLELKGGVKIGTH
ncbi:indole-3-glycerol phosphate synthase TrpC [Thermatribacter velox]|jgi:indole-3-glycerol phosphate synthase|uniref:indole-3-glycerol-phosphate synthase n=1 Tax=Thermatribacter velox TaxID=3039681 RepID=A0ABZ2YD87_9BACT|nr:indole-3-glycerol phosphate synthase [Candidatus Atribacteria bacterium]